MELEFEMMSSLVEETVVVDLVAVVVQMLWLSPSEEQFRSWLKLVLPPSASAVPLEGEQLGLDTGFP